MTGNRNGALIAGSLALSAIGLLIGGAFTGLLAEASRNPAGALAAFDPYLLRVARFTLWQALLSTMLAVLPALLVARALSRHPSFPGRRLLLQLFAVPLALPAIVAALGLLALYGRTGWLAGSLSDLSGGPWQGIYGLSGILIAHVFFNLPLATRLFLEALDTIPGDQHRLSAQLSLGPWAQFRLVEWPVMRQALPSAAGLVFMLCITSFTLVLVLGGGPRATTLEVGIYQALRFDFDPARAVALTLVQIVLTVAVVALLGRLGANMTGETNPSSVGRSFRDHSRLEPVLNGLLIALAAIFVGAPLCAVVVDGLQADLGALFQQATVRRALVTSLVLATLAALLTIALTLALIKARRALGQKARLPLLAAMLETGSGFVLVVPPIVIGAGWFILLRGGIGLPWLAPLMVVTVNGVMAMPFALRILRPAHEDAANRNDRLCEQLGVTGWNRLRLIDWPSLRGPLLAALAFAMALSLGDLGVIALFGSDQVQTLPYLLLARMGSYRTDDAAGLALLLMLLTLALVALADRLGSRR